MRSIAPAAKRIDAGVPWRWSALAAPSARNLPRSGARRPRGQIDRDSAPDETMGNRLGGDLQYLGLGWDEWGI